jgi:hypothetical protein
VPRSLPPSRSPTSVISFHCYMEGTGAEETRTSRAFALDGQTFSATDLQVPSAGGRGLHIDRYAHVARLLAPNFHYGALLSEAGTDLASADGMSLAVSLSGNDFLLTRVQSLASLDIFLEPEWIAKREDLLEVYPYHLHLKNYVHLFRRHYLRERGRL